MYSILHLEQSGFIKNIVKDILLRNGFNYISAHTAEEAYDILKNSTNSNEINLIITSLLIPDEGIENFIEKVNVFNKKHIPIFVVTGNELNQDKKKILDLGVSDYITKDSLSDELLKHIQFIIKEDELMNSLREAKIALLDDSNFDCRIAKDILDKYQIKNVDYYSTGRDLMDSNITYDLYLIDIVLEKEFGRDIIFKLRRNNIDCSIIILSSLTNTKTLASMLNAGANDYISKPIDEDIFIAKLKSNIRTYSLIRKNK